MFLAITALGVCCSAPTSTVATRATGVREGHTPAGERAFLFTYGAVLRGLKPGQIARVWLPVPPSNDAQQVETVRHVLPAEPTFAAEPKYGNRVLYLEAAARNDGTLPLSVTYRVTRREVRALPCERGCERAGTTQRAQAGPPEEELFLRPDSKVPVGPHTKPMRLLEGKHVPDDPVARARLVYDVVTRHMVYSKAGTGWGRGDAEWACDSRFGNCSDFHSVFISLARSVRLPAKFEMGFAIPQERGRGTVGGYHCWAHFKPGGATGEWVPVDLSEAKKNPGLRDYYFGNVTADRVAFTVGRDIRLVPKQDGPPLNFFIYPHVEVEGAPLPPGQVEWALAYEDPPGM
jgi:transglutaminase-like putative cysteine protease